MRVYHFTSRDALADIILDGAIKSTDARISKGRHHIGLCVVWLTTRADTTIRHGLPEEKRQVRFALEIPDREVQKWKTWARRHGIKQDAISAFCQGGANTWRISTRHIRPEWWIEAVDVDTGEVLLTPEVIYALPKIFAAAVREDLQKLAINTEAEDLSLVAGRPLTEAQILSMALHLRTLYTAKDISEFIEKVS